MQVITTYTITLSQTSWIVKQTNNSLPFDLPSILLSFVKRHGEGYSRGFRFFMHTLNDLQNHLTITSHPFFKTPTAIPSIHPDFLLFILLNAFTSSFLIRLSTSLVLSFSSPLPHHLHLSSAYRSSLKLRRLKYFFFHYLFTSSLPFTSTPFLSFMSCHLYSFPYLDPPFNLIQSIISFFLQISKTPSPDS